MTSHFHNPSHGQKVDDPKAPRINEGAGAITSDSLAAESTQQGGGFSQNRDAEPQGVSGSSSTFANKNTSGAERLDPAPDSEARMAKEEWSEERRDGKGANSYPAGVGGQDKAAAVENATRGSSLSATGNNQVDAAPTYVNSQYVDSGKPKGKKIREGDFDNSPGNNASFNQEIGTDKDPGRLAEQEFQRTDADAAGDAAMPRQKGASDDNVYGTLGGTTEA